MRIPIYNFVYSGADEYECVRFLVWRIGYNEKQTKKRLPVKSYHLNNNKNENEEEKANEKQKK